MGKATDAHQAAILDELELGLGAEQKRRIMDARVDPRHELTIGDALADGLGGAPGLTPEGVLDAVIREVCLSGAAVARGPA